MEFLKKINQVQKTDNELYQEFLNCDYTEKFVDYVVKKDENNDGFKPHIYCDLEFWKNEDIFECSSWLCNLKTQDTLFGYYYLKKILEKPLKTTKELNMRQDFIKSVNMDMVKNIKENLGMVKNRERNLLWFWKEQDEGTKKVMDTIYFEYPFLSFLNNNKLFMSIWSYYKTIFSPLYTALSPIIIAIIPYLLMRWLGINIGFFSFVKGLIMQTFSSPSIILTQIPFFKNERIKKIIQIFSKFISIFFYFQGIYYTYLNARDVVKITDDFKDKLECVKSMIIGVRNCNKIIEENNLTIKFNSFVNTIDSSLALQIKGVINLGNDIVFCKLLNNNNLLRNNGIIMTLFYDFINNRDYMVPFMKYFGIIDLICSIREMAEKEYICFPEYLEDNKPVVFMENLWHPVFKEDNVIYNSIGINYKCPMRVNKDIIVTGPNAGGKSTFIKSLVINIILSQTLTINFCSESKITPFSYINTYLHIQDTNGKESLFQTEIRRCKEHIDEIKDNKGLCLTVFDEIFSSTNHVEGYAGAKAFCKAIGKIKNSVSIITTHYTKLGSLRKNKFSNLHFEANENDGDITFDYKVRKGVSNQYVALKLMKQKGFDNELIEDAINITKAFNKVKKSVR